MKRLLVGALAGALVVIISGCVAAGPYGYGGQGQYGPPPGYQPPPPPPIVEKRTEPPVEKRVPGKIVVVPTNPVCPGAETMIPHCSVKPLPPDPGLKPFVLPEPAYCSMDRGRRGWQQGFLRAGETVWTRYTGTTPDSKGKRYVAVRVDRCRNLLEGLEIHEYPEIVERVEREIIHERETVVEERPYPVPQPPMPAYAPCPGPYLPPFGFVWVFNPQLRRPVLVRQQVVNRNVNIISNRNVNVNRNTNLNAVSINRTRVLPPRIAPQPRICPPRFAPPRTPAPRPIARPCPPGYAPRRGR